MTYAEYDTVLIKKCTKIDSEKMNSSSRPQSVVPISHCQQRGLSAGGHRDMFIPRELATLALDTN